MLQHKSGKTAKDVQCPKKFTIKRGGKKDESDLVRAAWAQDNYDQFRQMYNCIVGACF